MNKIDMTTQPEMFPQFPRILTREEAAQGFEKLRAFVQGLEFQSDAPKAKPAKHWPYEAKDLP